MWQDELELSRQKEFASNGNGITAEECTEFLPIRGECLELIQEKFCVNSWVFNPRLVAFELESWKMKKSTERSIKKQKIIIEKTEKEQQQSILQVKTSNPGPIFYLQHQPHEFQRKAYIFERRY
jgi:hypothetical protein